MTTVRLTGWQPGMQKISLTRLLESRLALSRSVAKGAVDDVLEGHEASLPVPDGVNADSLVTEIRELGAICEIRQP